MRRGRSRRPALTHAHRPDYERNEMPDRIARINWRLLLMVLILSAVGLAFINSANDAYFHKQLTWIGVGLAAYLLLQTIPYPRLMHFSYAVYAIGLILLVCLAIPGFPFAVTRNAATRWFRVFGFYLQPSEIMKFGIILTLARYLMYDKNYRNLTGLIGPFVLTLTPMFLILKQPDMGTTLLFLPILFAFLFCAGARLRHLLPIVVLGLFAMVLLYFFSMKPYQRARIDALITPSRVSDKLEAFQINQAMMAIGSGKIAGKGYRQSTVQTPERHNDFIFTVIAEETGLVGCSITIVLLFILVMQVLNAGAVTREPFGRLVCVGVAALFACQILINIGMSLRLAPITGMTLPFISYGGSSLITSYALIGLVGNISANRVMVLSREDFHHP